MDNKKIIWAKLMIINFHNFQIKIYRFKIKLVNIKNIIYRIKKKYIQEIFWKMNTYLYNKDKQITKIKIIFKQKV